MISPDWTPGEKDLAYATKLGFVGAKVRQMAGAFVRHHRSRGTLIADLYATWQTWCENEVKFAKERAERSGKSGQPTMYEIAAGKQGEQE